MKKFKPRHILNKYVGKVVLEKIFSHIIKFQINVAIYFCDFTYIYNKNNYIYII